MHSHRVTEIETDRQTVRRQADRQTETEGEIETHA